MNIPIPSVILLAAKPRSGKSHCIKYFMSNNKKNLSYGIVFTKTKFNGGYDYLPQEFVHPVYDENKVKKLMRIQKKMVEEGIKKNAFIIFDDCLESKAFQSQLMVDLITQYRHYNITVIISTQYIYKIPPTMRECASYCVIFNQSTQKSIEALHATFGQHYFKNYHEFGDYIVQNTKDYQFILVNVNGKDKKDVYKVMRCPSKIKDFELKYNTKIKKS